VLDKDWYNLAPSQTILSIRLDADHRALVPARWGLIPASNKDPKIGFSLTNARAEPVADKPAFRSAFKSKRCLIPS
jgi:putative SOS response-associated peptidase YedK